MKLIINPMQLMLVFICTFTAFAQIPVVSTDSAVTEQFLDASTKYMSGDYEGSIPLYSGLLERDTLLTKQFWHVLIDNLGMAYGISGDLDSAEIIFNYGLSKDSSYPLFYYNLACVYAERNDMEYCIRFLRTAYKFKNNTLEGESFPDPATDDSFQRFMKDESFLSALQEMQKK
jgi:hypothetical protein